MFLLSKSGIRWRVLNPKNRLRMSPLKHSKFFAITNPSIMTPQSSILWFPGRRWDSGFQRNMSIKTKIRENPKSIPPKPRKWSAPTSASSTRSNLNWPKGNSSQPGTVRAHTKLADRRPRASSQAWTSAAWINATQTTSKRLGSLSNPLPDNWK